MEATFTPNVTGMNPVKQEVSSGIIELSKDALFHAYFLGLRHFPKLDDSPLRPARSFKVNAT